MKRKKETPRLLIGWREWAVFPKLGGVVIKAKIDTGARTSALHAEDVELDRVAKLARFSVYPRQRQHTEHVEACVPLLGERNIRSSNGKEDLRPVVEMTLQLGELVWPIEVTLTRRDLMGFRLLLGRQALRKRVQIDPARSYLVGGRPD